MKYCDKTNGNSFNLHSAVHLHLLERNHILRSKTYISMGIGSFGLDQYSVIMLLKFNLDFDYHRFIKLISRSLVDFYRLRLKGNFFNDYIFSNKYQLELPRQGSFITCLSVSDNCGVWICQLRFLQFQMFAEYFFGSTKLWSQFP